MILKARETQPKTAHRTDCIVRAPSGEESPRFPPAGVTAGKTVNMHWKTVHIIRN